MFHFKQFDVEDNACAMKVGTDGVLLGGWAEPILQQSGPSGIAGPSAEGGLTAQRSFLDIGTGSGLIALMLAQRFPEAHILGIDIDEASARQAAENFATSPWSDRLEAKHISLQELTGAAGLFSLIVSNPPYFRDALKCPERGRSNARHTDELSYDELLRCAAQLLAKDGVLALILPAEAESDILTLAAVNGLQPLRLTRVHTTPAKPAKRILISLIKSNNAVSLSAEGGLSAERSFSETVLQRSGLFKDEDTTLDALNEPLLRDFYQHDFRSR